LPLFLPLKRSITSTKSRIPLYSEVMTIGRVFLTSGTFLTPRSDYPTIRKVDEEAVMKGKEAKLHNLCACSNGVCLYGVGLSVALSLKLQLIPRFYHGRNAIDRTCQITRHSTDSAKRRISV